MDKPVPDIPSREITDPAAYLNRRQFVRGAVLVGSVIGTGALYRALNRPGPSRASKSAYAITFPSATPEQTKAGFWTDETVTPRLDITHYNNFYEFATGKEAVAEVAQGFVTRPWTVAVEGLAHKPKVFDLDDLRKLFPAEERIYRMRCVEGWSMVIPWLGFPLAKLLEQAEPTSDAKFVQFQTLLDPKRMPNQSSNVLQWPYVEGLRIDEAMHPLTLLAHGLYGADLPPQNGAPLRLVVPWKYGFKGIKSIVKIRLVAEQPATTWNISNSDEYGFYSNVNPEVDHPRWSQAREQRIGEYTRRPTLLFNGYAEQVGHLYAGMDLRKNF